MNILPKKSWHVRNKDNIERVRRDETQAAAEEKERQRRIALAESEARLDKLRGKSAKHTAAIEEGETNKEKGEITNKEIGLTDRGGHLNLFVDEETGIQANKANKEHEAEEKAAKEKWEKSVGILTYLGQSSTEASVDKPWYFKPPSKKTKSDVEEAHASGSSSRKEEFDRKTKFSLDPMNQMGKYLEIKRKQKEGKDGDKQNKKHKHKKHKHKESKKTDEVTPSSGKKSIQELRAERERREREEKQRAERLLARHRGEKVEEQTVETDERKMKYHSQFNPEYVRTYKPKRRDYYDEKY